MSQGGQLARVLGALCTILSALAVVAPRASAGYDEAVTQQITTEHDGFASGGSLDAPPLAQRWSQKLGDSLGYPLIAQGKVFVVGTEVAPDFSSASTLYGLDPLDGHVVWSRPTGRGTFIAYDAGRIFALDALGTVTAVDAATGVTLWTRTLWEPFLNSAPVARDGVLYLTLYWDSGALYALDETDGSTVWTNGSLSEGGSPAVDGRDVYLGNGYSCVTSAIDRLTGRTAWTEWAGCELEGDWVAAGAGRVFSPFVSRDAATGAELDTEPAGPSAIAGSTSVAVNGPRVQARDVTTGKLLWSAFNRYVAESVIVVNSTVYAALTDGRLRAYDLDTGTLLWTGTVPDGDNSFIESTVDYAGMAAGGGLLAISAHGTLTAFEDAAPVPRPGLDLRILSGPDGPTDTTSAQFTFAATGVGFLYECRLDRAAWLPCAGEADFAHVAVGAHIFEVRTVTPLGDTVALAARGWSVYSVALDTQIVDGPHDPTNLRWGKFEISTTGNDGQECKLDDGPWSSCPAQPTFTVTDDGRHTLLARGKDSLARVDDTPASYSWTVDTQAPSARLTSYPSGTTTSRSASVSFESDDPSADFTCQLDAGPAEPCTSPKTYDNLSYGGHAITVQAHDPAGNASSGAVARWTITRDNHTRVDSGPASPTSLTTATVTFSSASASATYVCRVDDGAWASCTSPATYHGLLEGGHEFDVKSTIDGYTDPYPTSWVWSVDTTPPDTIIYTGPPDVTSARSASVSFYGTEMGSDFECALDGGPFAQCVSPFFVSSLSDGAHTVQVRAIDPAGNADPSPATRTWTVTGDSSLSESSSSPGTPSVVQTAPTVVAPSRATGPTGEASRALAREIARLLRSSDARALAASRMLLVPWHAGVADPVTVELRRGRAVLARASRGSFRSQADVVLRLRFTRAGLRLLRRGRPVSAVVHVTTFNRPAAAATVLRRHR